MFTLDINKFFEALSDGHGDLFVMYMVRTFLNYLVLAGASKGLCLHHLDNNIMTAGVLMLVLTFIFDHLDFILGPLSACNEESSPVFLVTALSFGTLFLSPLLKFVSSLHVLIEITQLCRWSKLNIFTLQYLA